jgi:hypothetical protein
MFNGPLGQRPLATNETQEWSMFNVQCSIFLLVAESTPFLALPRKQLPARYAIFVPCLGRKFHHFSLTLQRYKKFKALPNYSSKKAR